VCCAPAVGKYLQLARTIDPRMGIAEEEETEGYLGQENHWRKHFEGAAVRSGVGRATRQEKNARMVRNGKRDGYTDIGY
jgi:hypothetical protein